MWPSRCRALAAASAAASGSLLSFPMPSAQAQAQAHVDHTQTKERDVHGKERTWDLVTRTTRRHSMATAGVDAVIILPLLRSSSRPAVDTLLVQQFRPPVDAYTVELPAGLIDKGETAEQAAVRELKEETGYTGTARGKSSIPLTMSPGLSDETVKLVVVDVDMDKPENQQPQQELDEGEFIVVRRVSLASLPEELRSLALKGVMPITGDVVGDGPARYCALHVAGGTTEVEAQVFQTSPTSLASRELTLEVDDFLLRGVSLSTCLSQWGKHWSTHGADGGQYESQKSSDYEKSFQVPKYDHFLSHDWKTSRAAKVWSMFFVFNLPAATLASQICAIVVGLVRESEALWAPSHGAPHQLTTSLVPWLVFWLFFCFWQRLRSLLGRPLIVFLDRLCIAQHDPRLKEKGILGLSAFLDKSQSLTILWSKRYFTRLWCSYEVATFLRKESTSVANEQTDKSLTVFPVAMSWILILCFVEVSLVQAAVVLSLPLIAAVVAWEGLLHAVVYLTEKPGNLWGFNWLFGAALWLVLAAGLFCAKCSRLTSLG
eukprot:g8995.t1